MFGAISSIVGSILGGGSKPKAQPKPAQPQANTTPQAQAVANGNSSGLLGYYSYLNAANAAQAQTISTADANRLILGGSILGGQESRNQATTYVVLAVVLLGTAALVALTRR